MITTTTKQAQLPTTTDTGTGESENCVIKSFFVFKSIEIYIRNFKIIYFIFVYCTKIKFLLMRTT